MTESAQLLGMLADIERRSRASALAIPRVEVQQETWQGLTFTVAGVRLVVAMSEVKELLTMPEQITALPGAKPWMLGLANVRGLLLPIVDLQLFLGGNQIVPGRNTRLLVVDRRGIEVGILVSGVGGMRYFTSESRIDDARLEGELGDFVFSAYRSDDEILPVFSMSALTADNEFRVAAV